MATGDGYAAPLDPRKENVTQFDRFLGLRNNTSPESFVLGDLVTATNVDIDDAMNIHRRKGYSAPVTAAVDRDLWSVGNVCLGVGTNSLKFVNPDFSTVVLRSSLTPNQSLSYVAVGNRVFYSNGVELGCVQNSAHRTWGITQPGVPTAASTAGTMNAGAYQFAVTYLRNDGQESGTGLAGTITLAVVGGIALTNLPVSNDPTVVNRIVYFTPVNGEVLYRVALIDNAVTTFTLRDPQKMSSPLMTQFLAPPPPANILAHFRGYLLAAVGNHLYPSEAFGPELFDWRKSLPFNDRITMVAPIDDGKFFRQHGVYIGTDSQIIFLEGESPDKWQYRVLANYGVIPGTLYFGDGETLGGGDSKEKIAFFASKTGLCAGKMGGDFANLTQSRFAYPVMDRGAGIVRHHRGIVQYMVTLQGTAVAGNVAA